MFLSFTEEVQHKGFFFSFKWCCHPCCFFFFFFFFLIMCSFNTQGCLRLMGWLLGCLRAGPCWMLPMGPLSHQPWRFWLLEPVPGNFHSPYRDAPTNSLTSISEGDIVFLMLRILDTPLWLPFEQRCFMICDNAI